MWHYRALFLTLTLRPALAKNRGCSDRMQHLP